MLFISNAQLVDPKFMINPFNILQERKFSSQRVIFPNMTMLGVHIKISGNGNIFNKQKSGEIKDKVSIEERAACLTRKSLLGL
jgi:hypothetical protein